RRSMVNGMDETGWNVAAQLRWLWVAVSEQVTFCDILPGRGFDEAASILGADYKGWLTHDGWQVYYKFLKAGHQSCLNHLLDRVLNNPGRDPANRRFRNHLDHERPYLFTFLYCPGLDATNNVSERAIRALIGARKNWGGNRTPRGARAQAVLTSILQTAKQQ